MTDIDFEKLSHTELRKLSTDDLVYGISVLRNRLNSQRAISQIFEAYHEMAVRKEPPPTH